MERIFDVEQQYPDTEFKKYIHVSKLGIDSRLYNSYEACPDTIRLIVNSLEVYPTDSVVDIGCGKGYAMYAMAQKPFSQIDGIEICPHLAETALHNLSAIFGKGDRRFHIYTEDAALFDKWDDYTYAFMYNPFKEICMRMVIEHIRASIMRHPRHFSMIYYNPVLDSQVMASGIFSKRIILSDECLLYTI